MPTAQALRRCPHAIVLPVRMSRYAEISQQIHAIFERYTPLVEPLSLDEAFLDVTASTNLFGPAERIGREIKQRIKEETHLPASVGIAPNKFLAKLASDLEKPDGFVIITAQTAQQILDPLPVGRIWGIGRVAQQAFHDRGIHTIADLRRRTPDELAPIAGNNAAHLLQLAHGRDDRPVEATRQAKSLSSERTFATDISDPTALLATLLEEVEIVAQRLRRHHLCTKTITLKLRYGDFRTVTRSTTLSEATNLTQPLWETAQTTFRQWHQRSAGPLRLLGFAATSLTNEETDQKTLFPDPNVDKLTRLDKAVDAIRDRYGKRALHRGK
jgi:DNA polymerase-4